MKKKLFPLALALALCLGLTVPALAAERTVYLDGYHHTGREDYFQGSEEASKEDSQLSVTGDFESCGTVSVEDSFPMPVYHSDGPVTVTVIGGIDEDFSYDDLEDGSYHANLYEARVHAGSYDAGAKAYIMTQNDVLYFDGKVARETDITIEEQVKTGGGKDGDDIYNGAKVTLSEPGIYEVTAFYQAAEGGCRAIFWIGQNPEGGAPAEPADEPAKPAFTDVAENSPFKDAIAWAVEQNITKGTSATTFGPTTLCTHNHILTFLWRANGSPASEGANDFEKAIAWAKSKGLAETIDGSAACTRAQTMVYLWKLAGRPKTEASSAFTDVAADADYTQAVAWAVAQGVTKGTSATTFGPDNTCTRGQIVTFLYRNLAK